MSSATMAAPVAVCVPATAQLLLPSAASRSSRWSALGGASAARRPGGSRGGATGGASFRTSNTSGPGIAGTAKAGPTMGASHSVPGGVRNA